jgi:NTE family protein
MFRLIVTLILILISSACTHTTEVRPEGKPQKVALVLGAGASKGFAHIGVIKVLESNGIPIDMVVGTSAGSFVGSLYAYGFNAFDLQKIALSITRSDVMDLTVPDNGFIKGEKIEEYINRLVKNTPIERFKIPFYAVATDIATGKEVVFGMGNAGMAVRASCAIPGVFRPVKIGPKQYVDGGVVSPVAVNAARLYGADIVIAVDISGDTDPTQPNGTLETILKSIDIMYSKIALTQLSGATIVIRPNVSGIGSADFSKRHEAILEGEKAALSAIPEIKRILAQKDAKMAPARP